MSVLTEGQLKILILLNHYDRLTIRQLTRALGLMESNYTSIAPKLKALKEQELLDVVKVAITPGSPQLTLVYFVSEKGRRVLRAEGIDTPARKAIKAPDPTEQVSLTFWRHTLSVNDLFISLTQWARDNPDIEIEMLTEIDIRRSKDFPVETGAGNYSPDGWIDLTVQGRGYAFALELENAQYSEGRWEGKLQKMLGFHQVSDAADHLRFLIIAMEGIEHRQQLSGITARTVRTTERRLFLITATRPDDLALFTQAVWYYPRGNTPTVLVG